MVFGLWTALGGHGAPGIELAHNVRSPEDVDAVLAEAERAGGTVVPLAGRADWGGTTGAHATDQGPYLCIQVIGLGLSQRADALK